MKLKIELYNITEYVVFRQNIYFKQNENLYELVDNKPVLIDSEINTMVIFNNENLLFTDKIYSYLKIFGEKDIELKGHFALESIIFNKNFFIIPCKEEGIRNRKIFDRDFNFLKNSSFWPVMVIYNDLFIQMDYPFIINCYSFDSVLKWQTNLSQIGEYIKLNGTKASNNEFDGDVFGNEKLDLIYVPMKSGELVALEAETGKVLWVKHYQVSTRWGKHPGNYTIWEDKIYKTDGISLIEIDAVTGEWLKTINFEDIQPLLLKEYGQTETFYANGAFSVYDDVVVMYEVSNCQVLLIDRKKFVFKDFVHIPNVCGIPNSKDIVIWNNNKLYVLDIENTLHVFE
jgi:outer membrane protein assembly factor BamB